MLELQEQPAIDQYLKPNNVQIMKAGKEQLFRDIVRYASPGLGKFHTERMGGISFAAGSQAEDRDEAYSPLKNFGSDARPEAVKKKFPDFYHLQFPLSLVTNRPVMLAESVRQLVLCRADLGKGLRQPDGKALLLEVYRELKTMAANIRKDKSLPSEQAKAFVAVFDSHFNEIRRQLPADVLAPKKEVRKQVDPK